MGPYIFQNEVEKVIKEVRDKKATGSDVPGGCTQTVGRDGLTW